MAEASQVVDGGRRRPHHTDVARDKGPRQGMGVLEDRDIAVLNGAELAARVAYRWTSSPSSTRASWMPKAPAVSGYSFWSNPKTRDSGLTARPRFSVDIQ